MIYSAFLTPQGKYLADFFITAADGTINLEGEETQMGEVYKKLSLHKLRSDVALSLEPTSVYVSFENGAYKDPRHDDMGYRSYTQPNGAEIEPNAYHAKRIALAIPDAEDWDVGRSSPFQGNLDLLNAISFTKGCYMGQELVSRIHHRGLVKKRMAPETSEDGTVTLTAQKVS